MNTVCIIVTQCWRLNWNEIYNVINQNSKVDLPVALELYMFQILYSKRVKMQWLVYLFSTEKPKVFKSGLKTERQGQNFILIRSDLSKCLLGPNINILK